MPNEDCAKTKDSLKIVKPVEIENEKTCPHPDFERYLKIIRNKDLSKEHDKNGWRKLLHDTGSHETNKIHPIIEHESRRKECRADRIEFRSLKPLLIHQNSAPKNCFNSMKYIKPIQIPTSHPSSKSCENPLKLLQPLKVPVKEICQDPTSHIIPMIIQNQTSQSSQAAVHSNYRSPTITGSILPSTIKGVDMKSHHPSEKVSSNSSSINLPKSGDRSAKQLFAHDGHLFMPSRLDRYLKKMTGSSNRSLLIHPNHHLHQPDIRQLVLRYSTLGMFERSMLEKAVKNQIIRMKKDEEDERKKTQKQNIPASHDQTISPLPKKIENRKNKKGKSFRPIRTPMNRPVSLAQVTATLANIRHAKTTQSSDAKLLL